MSRVDNDFRVAILSELADTVEPKALGTWFRNIQFIRIDEDQYRIPLPNVYYRDVITRKFGSLIEDAFNHVLGFVPEIDYTVEKEQELAIEWPPENVEPELVEEESIPATPAEPRSVQGAGSRFHLNDQYTFDRFVTGPSNRLAHAAAQAVAEQPGEIYNPLFIHGSSGLGKTHLLQAVCHTILDRNPNASICYLCCEDFVNDYISAVQRGQLEAFRAQYRSYDALLIDDIHFLANKEGSQEEFFHTFNALHNAQRQLVLSSDSPPKDIPTLKERLVSRFAWGLVGRIDAPTLETRIAILRNKMDERSKEIPDDVLTFVATHIDSNIRELEGAVIKLIGMASLTNRPITVELAQETLKDAIEIRRTSVTVPDILKSVCDYYNVRVEDLQSKKRSRSITLPRQVSIYLARELTSHSLQEIGGFLGGKDHTTVMYSVRKIEEDLEKQADLRGAIEYMKRELSTR